MNIRRALTAAALSAGLVLSSVAATGADEVSSTRTATDADLTWGACPPFFPDGCQIAVLHGDPAQPNADVFFRVAPGYDLPHHWHTSAERMVLVSGELHVTYDGEPTTRLVAGAYAYGPPGKAHDGKCVSDVPCVLFIAFEGPVDAHPVTD